MSAISFFSIPYKIQKLLKDLRSTLAIVVYRTSIRENVLRRLAIKKENTVPYNYENIEWILFKIEIVTHGTGT